MGKTKDSELSESDEKKLTFDFSVTSENLSVGKLKRKVLLTIEQHTTLPGSDLLRLSGALEEALLNAHEHGNLELESAWKEEYPGVKSKTLFEIRKQERLQISRFAQRKIVIQLNIDNLTVAISVKDEGNGYKVETIGNEVTGRPHGMGLMLMKNFVDELRFNDTGNQVVFIKKHNHKP